MRFCNKPCVAMLRPGVIRFSVAAGQLRDESIEHKPNVVQATMQRGFTNMLTGYAGVTGSQGYAAVLLGSALKTRYGAFAMDVTAPPTGLPGREGRKGGGEGKRGEVRGIMGGGRDNEKKR